MLLPAHNVQKAIKTSNTEAATGKHFFAVIPAHLLLCPKTMSRSHTPAQNHSLLSAS
jgi:hypothetical protein